MAVKGVLGKMGDKRGHDKAALGKILQWGAGARGLEA